MDAVDLAEKANIDIKAAPMELFQIVQRYPVSVFHSLPMVNEVLTFMLDAGIIVDGSRYVTLRLALEEIAAGVTEDPADTARKALE